MDQGNTWLVLSVSGTIAFEDGSNYADGPEDQDKVIRFLKDWFADSDHEEACVAYQKGSGTGWLTRDWLLGVMNTGGEKYKVIEYSWSDGAVSADYFLVARPKA